MVSPELAISLPMGVVQSQKPEDVACRVPGTFLRRALRDGYRSTLGSAGALTPPLFSGINVRIDMVLQILKPETRTINMEPSQHGRCFEMARPES